MVNPQLIKSNIYTIRGVLNVNKPSGISSYDVIRAIKKIFGESTLQQKKGISIKLGHAGTLDPLANGVLLILFNEATKIAPFLVEQMKEYIAEIRLGIRTDTDDLTGKVLEEKKIPPLHLKQVQEVLLKFEGEINQIPPIFSALHEQGKRLYEIARAGKTIEQKPRKVFVYELELMKFTPPILKIRAVVSKGTYIRALARDIGEQLGCGGTLNALTRTRIGNFRITDAVQLNELTMDLIQKQMCSITTALSNLNSVYVEETVINRLLTGQLIKLSEVGEHYPSTHHQVKVFDREEKIMVIALRSNDGFKPIRLIYADIPKKQ
jgi:tRNA pseudouridine55 synthase